LKTILRQLSAFIAPVVMCAVLPYFVVTYEARLFARPALARSAALLIAGLLATVAGLALFIVTVRLFILIGRGTIMPWDPTRKLVIAGPYRYVRNPMILGVLLVQAGEALAFASYGLALLALLFFVVNTVYFVFSEEPGLEKRFGAEYVEYKRNVPRWLPRLTPWQPG